MYSFSVELNHIKDGAVSLPEDGILVNLSCLAIKKDLIMFGDIDGNITKWNIRNKTSKTINLKRNSEIKKIKFAPGKENLLLLVQFTDMMQILEVNNLESFSEFKLNNSKIKIHDSFWCSSDKVLVYFSDLTIKIFNINFRQLTESTESLAPSLYNFLDQKEINLIKFKSILFDLIDRNCLEEYLSKESNEYLNENLKDLLSKKFKQNNVSKIDQFALLSGYFNMNTLDTKFWSLFSNLNSTLSDESQKIYKYRHILKQNSFLTDSSEFCRSEMEILNFYKEKSIDNLQQMNFLLKDLILFNRLELVFNLLMETDSSNDNYTNNLVK